MLKVDYKVLVFVGGEEDVPQIELVNGVCTWDNSTGILQDEWCGSLISSVDISYGGNYEAYSPTTVKITAVSSVESTLKNFGLTMYGKRIEVHEISSYGTTIIKRGVIDSVSPPVGNTVTINVSHVVNKYNANLTPRIGDEYAYLVYGDGVNGIPVSVDSSQSDVVTGEIGNKLYPAFVVVSNTKYRVVLRSSYNADYVDLIDLSNFLNEGDNYLLSGENNSMIGTRTSNLYMTFVNGRDHATTEFNLQPMNQKDENHEELLSDGQTVIVRYTAPAKVYTPYGITPSQDNFKYKKDGEFYPFPSYVDSLKYYDDRVEIMDADNSGTMFIEPLSCHFSTVQEIENTFGGSYIVEGFSFHDDQHTTQSQHYTFIENSENLASRSDSDDYTSTAMGFQSLNDGTTGYSAVTNCVTYTVENPSVHENIFLTGYVKIGEVYVNGEPIEFPTSAFGYDYTVTVYAITVTNEDHGGIQIASIGDRNDTYGNGEQNLFPNETSASEENERYRYLNDSHLGASMILGNDIDLKTEFEFSETELRNPIKFIYAVSFGWSIPFSSNNTYTAKLTELRLALISKEPYSFDDMYVDGATNSDGVNDVPNAYVDTCSRQNLSTLGFDTPSDGWGLSVPIGDITTAVNTAEILANAPLIDLLYKSDKTGTKSVKYDMLRYGFGIGHIDKDGLETWSNISIMYTGGVEFTLHDISGVATTKSFDGNKVYTDIGITSIGGNIEVKNTEQSVYDSDYVSGIDDENDKKALWFAGNLLYQKYNVKNEFPKNRSECTNFVDVVSYIKNQYSLAGAVSIVVDGSASATLYERYTISFTTSTVFAIANQLWTGKGITRKSPHIFEDHTGVITGVSRNLKGGLVTFSAEMVGGSIGTTIEYLIDESGDRDLDIDESGTRDINYVEVI